MVRLVQNPEERQQALDIRRRVFVEEQGVPAELELDAQDGGAVHWLGWRAGQAVGTARLVRFADVAKVGRVAVLPEWRSSGLGRELMEEIHGWAKDQPLRQILLDAQVNVIPFYAKLGYQTEGEIFEEAGILHQRMVRWLV
ncbi:MAG: GNAT family N-acetyltransferase [Candidatus Eremiobacteraeota bacterium]|nr:GNAT family N-acetyltransferase [Candidatus Eremiobacteraeota bacterium]MCW5868350.1 GNAT family N-acetyltransferase [Candidatus Eremiobacteraeota bacterium]